MSGLTTYLWFCSGCERWGTCKLQRGASTLAAKHHFDTGHNGLYVGRAVLGSGAPYHAFRAELEVQAAKDKLREEGALLKPSEPSMAGDPIREGRQ